MSLFPEFIEQGLSHSLLGKAQGKFDLRFIQIRDFARNKHKTVDDTVCGGGAGMLLKPDVLVEAWGSAVGMPAGSHLLEWKQQNPHRPKTVLLSPQGKLLHQDFAKDVVNTTSELVLVTGHYEGVDERFIDLCVDEEWSIGDYVLTGGEFAALVVANVLLRLVPGVVGDPASIQNDSLERGLLKAPQYTRPREFLGLWVPDVLLGGNHAEIEKWRHAQSLERTQRKRPDLWGRIKK